MYLLSKKAAQVAGSLTLAIDAKAKAMKSQGVDVVSYGAGEPDFDTPLPICQAAIRAIEQGQTRYTPARGTLELRRAICEKLARRNNLTYTPDEIVVTNGAKQALHDAFSAILEENDEVILMTPCWVSYPELIRMAGGIPVLVERNKEDGFALDLQALESAITEKTKAIVVNSPDNPCGGVLSNEEVKALADLIIKHDLIAISDEIYEEFIYEGETPISLAAARPEMKERTVLVNGVSKTYAMTGWRIGYMACPEKLAKAIANWQGHATGNPNSIAQAAALEAISGPQDCVKEMVEEFKKRRNEMVRRIREIPGLSCNVPRGAFYVMADISQLFGKKCKGKEITDSMSFAEALLEQKAVAVVPGAGFFADDMIRLSYALSMEDLVKGLERLKEFVEGLE